MSEPIAHAALSARGISKGYREGRSRLTVLDGLELEIGKGERVAIVGRSGAGKSTLLHILAGLLDPDEGRVDVMGEQLSGVSSARRASIRNHHMGFVYQFHHLLPEFSARENIAMPLLLAGADVGEATRRADELLAAVDLDDRADHQPHELSGGERQRVSVARAVATRPAVVLADEPTGNLDSENAALVFELLTELGQSNESALIVVTHDHGIADEMNRALVLEGGVLRDLARR